MSSAPENPSIKTATPFVIHALHIRSSIGLKGWSPSVDNSLNVVLILGGTGDDASLGRNMFLWSFAPRVTSPKQWWLLHRRKCLLPFHHSLWKSSVQLFAVDSLGQSPVMLDPTHIPHRSEQRSPALWLSLDVLKLSRQSRNCPTPSLSRRRHLASCGFGSRVAIQIGARTRTSRYKQDHRDNQLPRAGHQ